MAPARRLLRIARSLLVVALLAVTLLAVAELGVRALYAYAFWSSERMPLVYERVYWAVPPWVANTSLMYDDPELGLWMKPDASRTYVNLFGPIGSLRDVGDLFNSLFPDLPAWANERPVWHLATNSLGLRGTEFEREKSPDVFRVVVLGDSWTVGINVEEELSYPARLRELLASAAAPRSVEVLNFGVIGGQAETGVRLLPRVLALRPDLVVVAYAQNDEAAARDTRPRPPRVSGPKPKPPLRWGAVLRQSELYKLYLWWSTPREDRIEGTLRHELTRPSAVPLNQPGRRCPNPGFAKTHYRSALDEIVATLGKEGIAVVLLYNNVPDFASHCTLAAMKEVAKAHAVPLVDSSIVLEELGGALAADLEKRYGLAAEPAAATGDAIEVVVRVDMSTDPFGRAPFVMGNAEQLGAFVPNSVGLYDDGTHGDQRARDGIWSRRFSFAEPQVLTYAFTNGATAGEWAGLENYRLRAHALRPDDAGKITHLPIAQFGIHALRSDSSHPDAIGHDAIARALAARIQQTQQLRPRAAGASSADPPGG